MSIAQRKLDLIKKIVTWLLVPIVLGVVALIIGPNTFVQIVLQPIVITIFVVVIGMILAKYVFGVERFFLGIMKSKKRNGK